MLIARDATLPRRLAALVISCGPLRVNLGAFALRCAESLAREWEREGGAAAALSLVLCDALEDDGEATWWRSLERMGVRIVPGAAAAGDAARVAQALAASEAAVDEPVLVLAPDVYFLPGSLRALLDALGEHPRHGLVTPWTFLDEGLQIGLPRAERRGARERALAVIARAAPAFEALHAAARLARIRCAWSEERLTPIAGPIGGCFMTRRRWLEAALDGASTRTLDELDAALMRKLKREDLRALQVAGARVVHHGSRWPGLGLPLPARPVSDRLHRLAGSAPRALRRFPGFDLGPLSEPPTLALARLAHYWIELAPESAPMRAGGILGAGASYAMPYRAWSWLPAGTYLAQAIDRQSGATLGRWRFEKRAPARSWPLDAVAVAQHEPHPPRGASRRAGG